MSGGTTTSGGFFVVVGIVIVGVDVVGVLGGIGVVDGGVLVVGAT